MFIGSTTAHTRNQVEVLKANSSHPVREFKLSSEPLRLEHGVVHLIDMDYVATKRSAESGDYFGLLRSQFDRFVRNAMRTFVVENGIQSLSLVATGGTTARDVVALLCGSPSRDVDA